MSEPAFVDPIPDVYEFAESNLTTEQFCLALTGSTSIPDYLTQETIDIYTNQVETDLITKFPCIGEIPANTLSPTEYDQYIVAVGVLGAYEWTKFPSNLNTVAPDTKEVKIGPVTERFGNLDGGSFQRYLVSKARKALNNIACIKAGRTTIQSHNVVSYRAAQEDDGEIIFIDRGLTTNVNV